MSMQRIIWLASFPKSGNTWMRYFLAQYLMPKGQAPDINHISQFTTSDARQDIYDRVAGGRFKAETFDDWVEIRPALMRHIAMSRPGTHFVKTHCRIQRLGPYEIIPPEVTAAAIYIMRNPFDVVPSFARHLDIDIDTAITKMADPVSVNMTPSGIFETIGRWDAHIENWLGAPGLPRHVVRYEDMKADTEKAASDLLRFLQVPVDHGQMRRAIRASSFSNMRKQEDEKGFVERPDKMNKFFHSGKSGGWREALSPEQVARIRSEFQPALEKHYPEMLEETAAFADSA